LAHLANAAGRRVHLLQWDVVRPVFEAHPVALPYPVKNGVTHGVIRKAIGLWVRQALCRWQQAHPGPNHLLIGETPFIGNRFIELAQSWDDATELLLTDSASVFVIPVPSLEVRHFIEAERSRRSANPVHHREGEDAPPQVLQQLWQELVRTAPLLGIEEATAATDTDYHPRLYQRVYEHLLRHRHTQVMPVDTIFSTTQVSVYDFVIPRADITPAEQEVAEVIHTIERRYPNPASLQEALAAWYVV
jgi:hypothetical protein